MGQDNGSRETVGKVVASPFVATVNGGVKRSHVAA